MDWDNRKLRLAGIAGDSIVDGPGIRMTLFAQGCPHHCQGCHNPETWEFDGGTWWTADDLVKVIEENPLAKGVTVSGGEPFSQAEAFAELAGKLKNRGYEVASYSGFTMEELLRGSREQRMLLEKLDVLIDGPYIEEQRSLSLAYRGSRNQRIIDVPASLRTGEITEMAGRILGKYVLQREKVNSLTRRIFLGSVHSRPCMPGMF